VFTQLIMIAIVVTTAATLYIHHQQVQDAAGAARVEGVIQLADASELARPLAATLLGCAA